RRSQSMTVDNPSARKLRLTTACTIGSAPVIDTTLPPGTQERRQKRRRLIVIPAQSAFRQTAGLQPTAMIEAAPGKGIGGESGAGRASDRDCRAALVPTSPEGVRWLGACRTLASHRAPPDWPRSHGLRSL